MLAPGADAPRRRKAALHTDDVLPGALLRQLAEGGELSSAGGSEDAPVSVVQQEQVADEAGTVSAAATIELPQDPATAESIRGATQPPAQYTSLARQHLRQRLKAAIASDDARGGAGAEAAGGAGAAAGAAASAAAAATVR